MLVSNLEVVPGKRVKHHYGVVQASTVQSKNVGRDIMASIKNVFGGELKGYTQLMEGAREQAIERLEQQAESLGANAVVNVRFATSAISAGASEILVYGTAVSVEDR
jgi:uncharacterized protein YbjQ (UPF0145 family)